MDFEAFGQICGRSNIVRGTIGAEERFEGMQQSMTNREFSIDYARGESLDGAVGDKVTVTAYLILAITEDTRKNALEHFKMGGPHHFEFEHMYDPTKDPGEGWDARGWRIISMKLRLVWTENDKVDRFEVFTKGKAASLH